MAQTAARCLECGGVDSVGLLDRGLIHVPGGAARDVIVPLRMAHSVKLRNSVFLEFPI